eukprot:10414-Heterococcus_DN1.PRE.1
MNITLEPYKMMSQAQLLYALMCLMSVVLLFATLKCMNTCISKEHFCKCVMLLPYRRLSFAATVLPKALSHSSAITLCYFASHKQYTAAQLLLLEPVSHCANAI